MHLCVGTGFVNTVSPRHNLSSYLTVHEQRCQCIREGGRERGECGMEGEGGEGEWREARGKTEVMYRYMHM